MVKTANAGQFFGEATFEYEGHQLTITIDNMALVEAEGVLDESMMDFIPKLVGALESGRNPQMRHLGAIIAGGLKRNHPDIAEDYVYNMVMSQDPAVLKGLMDAFDGIEVPEETLGNSSAATVKPNRATRRAAKPKK